MAKQWAKKFYHSKEWLKVRKIVLIRDHYLCVKCSEAAKIVHHIIELTQLNIDDTTISLNMDNLICVCHECHNEIHEVNTVKSTCDGLRFDSNGDIIELEVLENLREE